MRLHSVKIQNFRGYQTETTVELSNLSVFIGKNDVGKSTILEALDIFFNNSKGAVKLDKGDVNKAALQNGDTDIKITAIFEDLPSPIVIDTTNETELSDEFLLNPDGRLEITKKFPNAGAAKVFINAKHPTHPSCSELLLKTQAQLRKIIQEEGIACPDQNRNAAMRAAIWGACAADLQLENVAIDITKGETKSIYDKLQDHFPLYSLFQSDRKNSDGDSEVQDPLQHAVEEILNDQNIRNKLREVSEEVEKKLGEVATATLAKLREMNPRIANSLTPEIPSPESLKWKDVFKSVSISGDEGIPINKRGSGVKRLILLNFFRAQAERPQAEESIPSIIYAVEEPETSQHTEHQKELIKAFKKLSDAPNTQIFLTTHSPSVVKQLDFHHLKMVTDSDQGKSVVDVEPGQLPYPSLNEVNCLAFDEATEEYHNELFGFIVDQELLTVFKGGKATMAYIRQERNGVLNEQKILTEYIRHQIHHPENTQNARYTFEQLKESIHLMREFIRNQS
jgi:predicted ATP-dependent endonuclease of OLD family